MDITTIKLLSDRVIQLRSEILTEEATKHSLILPFIHMLGYNVTNPKEVIPEYTADFGIKKGEKVDYAIIVNGKPLLIIEAKSCKLKLNDNNASQLYRYFTVCKAKYAILTNGVEYRLYTDIDEVNIMDRKPAYKIDMTNTTPKDLDILMALSKEKLNINTLQLTRELLKTVKSVHTEDAENSTRKTKKAEVIKSIDHAELELAEDYIEDTEKMRIIKMFLNGVSTTNIRKTISRKYLTNKAIAKMLKHIGLWAFGGTPKYDWCTTTRTFNELKYMKTHGIEPNYEQLIAESTQVKQLVK